MKMINNSQLIPDKFKDLRLKPIVEIYIELYDFYQKKHKHNLFGEFEKENIYKNLIKQYEAYIYFVLKK